MIFPKRRGCQGSLGQGNHYIFFFFEVKEAIKVIEAVEVIMPNGANEATEVIRLT